MVSVYFHVLLIYSSTVGTKSIAAAVSIAATVSIAAAVSIVAAVSIASTVSIAAALSIAAGRFVYLRCFTNIFEVFLYNSISGK